MKLYPVLWPKLESCSTADWSRKMAQRGAGRLLDTVQSCGWSGPILGTPTSLIFMLQLTYLIVVDATQF